MSRFYERVTEALQGLAPGEVVTYGELAAQAGHPGAARAVGNALRSSTGLPWWRVVTSTGRLVPRYEAEQTRKLEAEGVTIRGGRVVTGSTCNGTAR